MPRRPAARKSLRQNVARRLRNKIVKSRLHTEETKFARLVEHGDMAAAEQQLNLLTKLLQRAAARRIVPDNTAARTQARLQEALNLRKTSAPA